MSQVAKATVQARGETACLEPNSLNMAIEAPFLVEAKKEKFLWSKEDTWNNNKQLYVYNSSNTEQTTKFTLHFKEANYSITIGQHTIWYE